MALVRKFNIFVILVTLFMVAGASEALSAGTGSGKHSANQPTFTGTPIGRGSSPARLSDDGTVYVADQENRTKYVSLCRIEKEIFEALKESRGSFYGVFDLDKDEKPEIFLDYFKVDDPTCSNEQKGGISCIHLVVYRTARGACVPYLNLEAQSWGYAPGAWFLDEPPHPKVVVEARTGGSSGTMLFYLNASNRSLDAIGDIMYLEGEPIFEDLDGDGMAEIFMPGRGRDRTSGQGAAILHWRGETYHVWWPTWKGLPYVIYGQIIDLKGRKGVVAVLEPQKYDDVTVDGDTEVSRELGIWSLSGKEPALVAKIPLPNSKYLGRPVIANVTARASGIAIVLDYFDNTKVECTYRNNSLTCSKPSMVLKKQVEKQ